MGNRKKKRNERRQLERKRKKRNNGEKIKEGCLIKDLRWSIKVLFLVKINIRF